MHGHPNEGVVATVGFLSMAGFVACLLGVVAYHAGLGALLWCGLFGCLFLFGVCCGCASWSKAEREAKVKRYAAAYGRKDKGEGE